MTQRTADALEGATLAGLEGAVGLAKERIRRANERMGPIELLMKKRKVDRDWYLQPGVESALNILRMVHARDGGPETVGGTLRVPWEELRSRRPGPGVLPPVARPTWTAPKKGGVAATDQTLTAAWNAGPSRADAEVRGRGNHIAAPRKRPAGRGPAGRSMRGATQFVLGKKPVTTYFVPKREPETGRVPPKPPVTTYFVPTARPVGGIKNKDRTLHVECC
jgi:hypothetical protein